MALILHITAHMGGGVGRFLSQTTVCEKKNKSVYQHKILLLEKPEKAQFIDLCKEQGIDIETAEDESRIGEEIKNSDIVVLHWWHHPVMCRLMYRFPNHEVRLVLWSHVSGCNYPALPAELAAIPHKVFFTTPYSYENPLWSPRDLERIRRKSQVVYGLGSENNPDQREDWKSNADLARKNVEALVFDDEREREVFVVSYTGTLSKSKIHPDFINYCIEVVHRIPCVKFVMLGDLEESRALMKEAKKNNIERYFNFVGYTDQVEKYLHKSDVFGYPLNPFHFGTTENSVIEAMAAGLPVVMLNQCTEKYIVNHGHDGLLAENKQEYAQYMEFLYRNPQERIRLGQNALRTISDKYSLKRNVERMHEQFDDLMHLKKSRQSFQSVLGEGPIDWFVSCLGENKKIFESILSDRENEGLLLRLKKCQPILRGKSKGSVIHFAETFPEDKDLELLKQMLISVE